jgi:hypothetical protein
MNQPGRFCPAAYQYGAAALREVPTEHCETLYVVGGLYGNEWALDAVEALAAAEPGPVTIVFNGDFNWFNVDSAGFRRINERVLSHAAIPGNVEYELAHGDGQAGCGCAYPEWVDGATVERSNAIHERLAQTAALSPAIVEALRTLPRLRRYRIGVLRLGVVHGDADSLAGWRFSRESLDGPANCPWLEQAFRAADVDGFASSHTCLPVCRSFGSEGRTRFVINNGATGMPNFRNSRFGIVTRVGLGPAPARQLYGLRINGVHVDAIGVDYDHARWAVDFLSNWPLGSAAWQSYWSRIVAGPDYPLSHARPGAEPLAPPGPACR